VNWRNDRLGLQVERALANVRLTRGCELDVFIHDGTIELGAQLANESELAAVLKALMYIPGVLEVRFCVAVAEPNRPLKDLWDFRQDQLN
jgi:hypothetical protein